MAKMQSKFDDDIAILQDAVAELHAKLDTLIAKLDGDAPPIVAEPKPKNIKCPLCDFVTSTGGGLFNHQRFKHPTTTR
jgi:hypothetical protein